MNKIIEYFKGFPERFKRYAQICKEIDEKTAREKQEIAEKTAREKQEIAEKTAREKQEIAENYDRECKEIDEETARKIEARGVEFAREFNIDPNDKEAINKKAKLELLRGFCTFIITLIIMYTLIYLFY